MYRECTERLLPKMRNRSEVIRTAKSNAARKQINKLLDHIAQLVVAPHSRRTVPDHQDEQVREVLEALYRIIYY